MGNSFSYIDNLTMVRGAHTLKFGVEIRRIQLDQGNTSNGTVIYSSLQLPASSFLVNSVSSATYNDSAAGQWPAQDRGVLLRAGRVEVPP